MATLHQKLATSLEKLRKLQTDGRHVFRSNEFPRVDRERLLAQGFLREVIKGWLISISPGTAPGDVTPDLIDRVRAGKWNPEAHEADRKNRDALAARGYWQAFQSVQKAVAAIMTGAEAA